MKTVTVASGAEALVLYDIDCFEAVEEKQATDSSARATV